MLCLDNTYQKLIAHLYTMQKALIFFIICFYFLNYSITSGSLCNFYRDEVNDSAKENNNANKYIIKNNKTTVS